jgi:hypothetical protein
MQIQVYLSGNLGEVGSGKADGVLLEELSAAAAYLFDMQLPKGQTLQYRITCGSLETVEVGADGKRIEPRILNLDQDQTRRSASRAGSSGQRRRNQRSPANCACTRNFIPPS